MVDRRRLDIARPCLGSKKQQGEAVGSPRNRDANPGFPWNQGVEIDGEVRDDFWPHSSP
jgi:hypothetical protein